ncbi:MAG: DUF899 domain-containing protein [Ignavibacteriae bacterium]|nr:MAG: DUF899 domain-containing protein [Ignavibacteriota bacterium]
MEKEDKKHKDEKDKKHKDKKEKDIKDKDKKEKDIKDKDKKEKHKKDKTPKELEKKLYELENEITEKRKKMLKVLSKMAKMEIAEDYILKDRDNNDIKLSDLFGDKQDLIVIHNMGKACSYCTMWADGFNGIYPHIEKKAAFALVSPDAPDVQKSFSESRGWKFNMYSAKDSGFTKDMGYVTEKDGYWPGASVFHKDENGKIERVSKTFFGPGDYFCSVWHFFDMLPAQENGNE